jgi:hypothetical protein
MHPINKKLVERLQRVMPRFAEMNEDDVVYNVLTDFLHAQSVGYYDLLDPVAALRMKALREEHEQLIAKLEAAIAAALKTPETP